MHAWHLASYWFLIHQMQSGTGVLAVVEIFPLQYEIGAMFGQLRESDDACYSMGNGKNLHL